MSDRDYAFPRENGKFKTSYLPEIETVVTQNLACQLEIPLLLPVPNFIVTGVSYDRFWGSGLLSPPPVAI